MIMKRNNLKGWGSYCEFEIMFLCFYLKFVFLKM